MSERLEAAPSLPPGSEERFKGYGVMGLPFESGHVLALRRFPASSVGPPYSSIWHRTPRGEWTFYVTVPPRQSCPRFFGAAADRAIETGVDLLWLGSFHLRVTMPEVGFEWEVATTSTPAVSVMNAAGRVLPERAWHNSVVLAAMGTMAGPLLRVGRVGLRGTVPNGQRFMANPRLMWSIAESHATLAGEDLGRPGPVHPQARLGDFWIPQRGVFAVGLSSFEAFDPARHSWLTCRPEAAAA
jgi:hypothetical protein